MHKGYQSEDNTAYTGVLELNSLEANLRNYNTFLAKKIHDFLPIRNTRALRVIDFGAETLHKNYGLLPLCVELDPSLQKILKEKGIPARSDIPNQPSYFDVVYTVNVLEHIEQDIYYLKKIYDSLVEAGTLIIYVPAFPILYSAMDRQVGHVRRYTQKEVCQKLKETGFAIQSCNFVDSLGFIATLLIKIFSFNRANPARSSNLLKLYNLVFFPISIFLDTIMFQRIFGKNILVVANKIKMEAERN